MQTELKGNGQIDLGDELLAEIIRVVQSSPVPADRKVKTLIRAGRIGEMYLGQLGGDGSLSRAFTSSEDAPLSPEAE
ncbi:MAG: hypothetical protein ABSD88_06430 [Candidatus Korobacteraceae bacterium]|jgi:hypothetical protein